MSQVHDSNGAVGWQPLRRLRLLVVEDHPVLCRALESVCKMLDIEARFAGTIAAALLIAHEESFDALLSDVYLPDGNGWQLLRQLKEAGRQPPCALAMSVAGLSADIAKSYAAGFACHLVKPFSPDQLEQALREARRDLPSTSNDFHRARIIVADDHEWILQILVQVVREALPAAEIVASEDGVEALAAFEEGGADFLISNHRMPNMDGPTLVREARQRAPELPILMVSVHPEVKAEALAAGANWFLTKEQIPVELAKLLRAQASLLR